MPVKQLGIEVRTTNIQHSSLWRPKKEQQNIVVGESAIPTRGILKGCQKMFILFDFQSQDHLKMS